MSDLLSSLSRVDPTNGLVAYTKAIKPYHSKVLDVSVEYVYAEKVSAIMTDRHQTVIEFSRTQLPLVYTNGYGYRWSPAGDIAPEQSRAYVITYAHGPYEQPVMLASQSSVVAYSDNQLTLPIVGEPVTLGGAEVAFSDGLYVPGTTLYIRQTTAGGVSLSRTTNGPALTAVTDVSCILTYQSRPVNCFQIQTPAYGSYRCLPLDLTSNQMGFVSSLPVIGVSPVNRTWLVSGNVTIGSNPLTVDSDIFINSNSAAAANGRYKIASITFDAFANTSTVAVDRPITVVAGANGTINKVLPHSSIPYWPEGCGVRVTSNGTYPAPLSSSNVYYFVPTSKIGIFHLSKVRYPTEYTDYIDIGSLGSGGLSILRAEPFTPGESVKVHGSTANANDGIYTVAATFSIGNNQFIRTLEAIKKTTPLGKTRDGAISTTDIGFGGTAYTALANSSDIHTDSYVSETFTFAIDWILSDAVGSTATTGYVPGWGSVGFDLDDFSQNSDSDPHGIVAHSVPVPLVSTHNIFDVGFDTGFFGVGPPSFSLDGN